MARCDHQTWRMCISVLSPKSLGNPINEGVDRKFLEQLMDFPRHVYRALSSPNSTKEVVELELADGPQIHRHKLRPKKGNLKQKSMKKAKVRRCSPARTAVIWQIWQTLYIYIYIYNCISVPHCFLMWPSNGWYESALGWFITCRISSHKPKVSSSQSHGW